MTLTYMIHEDGRAYAAAVLGDVIVAAAEVPEDVELDDDALPTFTYDDALGASLDAEYAAGSVARIVASYVVNVY